ncbi:Gfo/Idh/MocA family oxidoreductase [Pseudomonas sp. NPDC007930]|uniref:Gfo/Idh/MocA family protein n=1 Tax=Pseudomonas sp. NPDC007930 TaxID=3364417 RepID=UPI0036E6F78B
MNPVHLAVAGAGLIGRRHIEHIQASPGCTLAAIIDPTPAAQALASSLGCRWFANLEALPQGLVDGVILATPNALHVSGALACIERGLPALIEKPVAHSVEEGQRLLAAAERAGARLLVGHHRAHSAIMRQACAVIASGALGRLVTVMGSAQFYKPADYFAAGPWRTQPGGGPILLNMIHEVGNLRALCGEIASVQAQASNAVRGFAVEDSVAMTFTFENGTLGSFVLSDTAATARSWEQTSGENPDYARDRDEDCYLVAGTHGSLAVPSLRLKTYPGAEQRSWFTPFSREQVALEEVDPLREQLAHFCAVIRGEAEPLVSVRDGLRNLLITEAIAEAARSGQVVRV